VMLRDCTHAATDRYYSYRRDGRAGRIAGVIGQGR